MSQNTPQDATGGPQSDAQPQRDPVEAIRAAHAFRNVPGFGTTEADRDISALLAVIDRMVAAEDRVIEVLDDGEHGLRCAYMNSPRGEDSEDCDCWKAQVWEALAEVDRLRAEARDFYEDDENPAEIAKVFAEGDKAWTATPGPTYTRTQP